MRLQDYTDLRLHIHDAGLVLSQNSVNGLQTGAVQIIFILTIFYKSTRNITAKHGESGKILHTYALYLKRGLVGNLYSSLSTEG